MGNGYSFFRVNFMVICGGGYSRNNVIEILYIYIYGFCEGDVIVLCVDVI